MMKAFGFRFFAEDKTKATLAGISAGLRQLADQAEQGKRRLNDLDRSLKPSNVIPFNRSFGGARTALQQFGFQAADTAVMLEMGVDPMRTMVQQGSQMLAVFGPLGAIMGAAVAVFGTLGIVAAKSGGDLTQLADALGVLAPAFTAMAEAGRAAFGFLIDAANVLVNNLDRLIIYATTFAAVFGAKWVAGFVAARIATMSLVGALTALRGALVRTGFGAIIVAAGELMFQFLRLVEGAGGFGNAMEILRGIAVQAFQRMEQAAYALLYAMQSVAAQIQVGFLESFQTVYDMADKLAVDLPSILPQGVLDVLGWVGIEPAKKAGDLADALDDARHMADSFGNSAKIAWGEASKPIDTSALTDALNNTKNSAIDLRDVFGGTGGGEDTVGGAAKGAADKAKAAVDTAAMATWEWLKGVQSIGRSIGESVGQGLKDLVQGTKDWRDAFRDTAADIIGQLWDIFVTQRIVNAAAAALTGNGSTSGGLLGGLLRNAGAGVVGKASGGAVQAGKQYLVNENSSTGSERFIPGISGTIMPADDRPSGMTVIVNQTINLSAGVAATVRQELAAQMPRLAQLSREAVYDAQKRGAMI